jgi:ribose transport system permease protein
MSALEAPAPEPQPEPSEPTRPQRARRTLQRLPDSAALIAFLVVESICSLDQVAVLLAWDNWLNILTAIAVIGTVAAPGTLLMTAGSSTCRSARSRLHVGDRRELGLSHSLGFVGVAVVAAIGWAHQRHLVTVVGVNALITTPGTLAVSGGLSNGTTGQTVPVDGFSYPERPVRSGTSRCQCWCWSASWRSSGCS